MKHGSGGVASTKVTQIPGPVRTFTFRASCDASTPLQLGGEKKKLNGNDRPMENFSALMMVL